MHPDFEDAIKTAKQVRDAAIATLTSKASMLDKQHIVKVANATAANNSGIGLFHTIDLRTRMFEHERAVQQALPPPSASKKD